MGDIELVGGDVLGVNCPLYAPITPRSCEVNICRCEPIACGCVPIALGCMPIAFGNVPIAPWCDPIGVA